MIFSVKIKVCEVLQLEAKTNSLDYEFGIRLFKLYEKRIIQASKVVRDTFTIDNIAIAFANFRYLTNTIINYSKRTENLKLPLYKNLTDPCFLLMIYSGIHNNKVGGMYTFPCDNVTLTDLMSLALTLLHKKYLPKPTKRIFMPVANKKMRSLGIASSLDNIVQQALTIVLTPRFECVFSDSPYSFRPNRSYHSVLKHIHNHWRDVY
jgi:hypothetical protein